MNGRLRALATNPKTFWLIAFCSITVWSFVPHYQKGWDFANFKDVIVSLRAGHDPYRDALAVQNSYWDKLAHHIDVGAPLSYVYSPATIPLLKVVSKVPLALSGTLYWMLFGIGFITFLVIGTQWADEQEKKWVLCLAPFALFFPGLLQNDVIFSGNVAIPLYGCVFAAAMLGWKREKWLLFYVTVLVASIFKAPMLSLLALPILSSRKQRIPSVITGLVGVLIFCMQPHIWPSLFSSYVSVLNRMFVMARDFSSSPAGMLTQLFYNAATYQKMLGLFYLAYAIPVFGVLLFLAPKYFSGQFTLKQWAPVMVIGVILLNPRINEYDAAPITLAMGLILWRFLSQNNSAKLALAKMSALFLVTNLLTTINFATVHLAWRWTECSLLVFAFATGTGTLLAEVSAPVYAATSFLDDIFDEDLAPELTN